DPAGDCYSNIAPVDGGSGGAGVLPSSLTQSLSRIGGPYRPMDLPISRPERLRRIPEGIAPQETLSGSMHNRKSRAQARLSSDFSAIVRIPGDSLADDAVRYEPVSVGCQPVDTHTAVDNAVDT